MTLAVDFPSDVRAVHQTEVSLVLHLKSLFMGEKRIRIIRSIEVYFLVCAKDSWFKRPGCAETPTRLNGVSQRKTPVLSLSVQDYQ
jgi:hypothetical protein